MKTYELLYIIPPKFTDKETSGIVGQIENLLKEAKINILESRPFEKRPLAYPINHCHFGIYGLIKFESEEETIKKIDEKLRLMPEVIRHQLLKYVETQRPEVEKFKKATAPKKIKKTTKSKMEKEEKIETKEEKIEEKPAETAKTKKEKIKLEELDKKLEEILKE